MFDQVDSKPIFFCHLVACRTCLRENISPGCWEPFICSVTLSIMLVLFIVVSQLSRHALPSASATQRFCTRHPTRSLGPYTHRSRILVPLSLSATVWVQLYGAFYQGGGLSRLPARSYTAPHVPRSTWYLICKRHGWSPHAHSIFIAAVYLVSTTVFRSIHLCYTLRHAIRNVMAYTGVENEVERCPGLLFMQPICSAALTHTEIIYREHLNVSLSRHQRRFPLRV